MALVSAALSGFQLAARASRAPAAAAALETPPAVGPNPVLPAVPSSPARSERPAALGPQASGPGVALMLRPKKPGRWIVDAAMGPGADRPALGEVLASVSDGDVVLVRPGSYRGALTISKSVTIEGEGAKPEDVQIDSDGLLTAAVAGGKVVFRNLTLANSGSKLATVLSISKAEASLERVHVRAAGQGVRVSRGGFAASRCVLASRIALIAEDRSLVAVEDCAISGTDIGALVKGDAIEARFLRCRFTDSERGLNVEGRSRLEVEDSVFSALLGHGGGLFAFAGAHVRVKASRFLLARSSRAGIYVEDAVLEGDNVRIQDSVRSGVVATKEASVTLDRSQIINNAWAGVAADKRSRVTLRRTTLTGNSDCALQANHASLTLDRVTAERNRCGVGFFGAGTLEVNHSRFAVNALGSLAVTPGFENRITMRGADNEGFSVKAAGAATAPPAVGQRRFAHDIFSGNRRF